jgi:hypothetical protein
VYDEIARRYARRLASLTKEGTEGDAMNNRMLLRYRAILVELLPVERKTAVRLRNEGRILGIPGTKPRISPATTSTIGYGVCSLRASAAKTVTKSSIVRKTISAAWIIAYSICSVRPGKENAKSGLPRVPAL